MPATNAKAIINDGEDEESDNGSEQSPPTPMLTERTPLLISAPSVESINNPLHEGLTVRRQKLIYSAITLADIFQKVVHTTFIVSFLLFTYTYLNLPYEQSLIAFYIFSICSGVFAGIINMNIEYFLSRQNAIVAGFIIYTIGLAIMSGLSAHLKNSAEYFQYLTLLPLLLICIGDGICKSCISDFTHSQFENKYLPEKLGYYLMKLFWIGHIGAFFLILFLLGIVEYTKFELGYGLSCVCALAGLISFLTAWNKFEAFGRNKSSVVKLIWQILRDAKNKNVSHTEQRKRASTFYESLGQKDFVQHWMDFAKHTFGGSHSDTLVDQTKNFFRISVLFLSFVPYWVSNAQCYSMFIYQGFHLRRTIGSATIPVTWVALCHVAAVLMFVQLLDKVINPFFRRRGYNFSPNWKISIGMVFGIISMLCATFLEYMSHKEKHEHNQTSYHMIGSMNVTYVAQVHILWTIPQFTFLGISEVLIGLTGLGLACRLCKGLLQKGITSLYYFTIALGHTISLIIIMGGWFPSGHYLDKSSMVTFFACMAGSCFISLVLFLLVVYRFDFNQRPTTASLSRSRTSIRSSRTSVF